MEPTLILHVSLAACILGTGLARHSVRAAATLATRTRLAEEQGRAKRTAIQARFWVTACIDHVSFAIARKDDQRLSDAKHRLEAVLDRFLKSREPAGLPDWLEVSLDTLIRDADKLRSSETEPENLSARMTLARTIEALADQVEARERLKPRQGDASIGEQIAALKGGGIHPRTRLHA